ncbi:MAG TPA: cupin domain-containing protein [Verrucomicrobiae bacterium]|nr:cupin domain-containing protein [Verrucomicrobiae bacterium]
MKFKAISSLLASGLCAAVLAGDQVPISPVLYFDAQKVAAAFAKSAPLVVTDKFKVQTGNRTTPGEVEIHEWDTDVFYIMEGSATFVTGGVAVDPKQTAPGETRAVRISGGKERRLAKGDVIVIPNRVPHWFKKVHGHMIYFAVKVTDSSR